MHNSRKSQTTDQTQYITKILHKVKIFTANSYQFNKGFMYKHKRYIYNARKQERNSQITEIELLKKPNFKKSTIMCF